MARPSKLTPEAQAAITRELAAGGSMRAAAAAGGVHIRTLERWIQRDDHLADDVAWARAQARLRELERVGDAAAGGDWRAAAWLLEQLFPDEFGPLSR